MGITREIRKILEGLTLSGNKGEEELYEWYKENESLILEVRDKVREQNIEEDFYWNQLYFAYGA